MVLISNSYYSSGSIVTNDRSRLTLRTTLIDRQSIMVDAGRAFNINGDMLKQNQESQILW